MYCILLDVMLMKRCIFSKCTRYYNNVIFAEETDRLVTEGSNIKVSGAPGAFGKEFQDMEEKLDEVRRIVAGTNITTEDLDTLREKLNQIR